MSDFTFANLILTKDVKLAKRYLEKDRYLCEFNDKWSLLLTSEDNFFDIRGDLNVKDWFYALSEKIPILYFHHPEEDEFGFLILHNRKCVSSLLIQYDYLTSANTLAIKFAKELYGKEEGFNYWHIDFGKELGKQVIETNYRDKYIHQILSNTNLDNFKLFEFSDEVIDNLKKLLTWENVANIEYLFDIAENFMSIIGIQDLRFTSYERFMDGGEFKII